MTPRVDFEPPPFSTDGSQWFLSPSDFWDHIDMATVRARFAYARPPFVGTQIQLGAGRKKIQTWNNLDFPEWDAHDQKSDRWRLPFGDGKVSEVVSYHTLDHLEPWAVVRTLREIQRVLCRRGTFTNIVPHGDSQLAKECIMHKSRFMVDTFRNIFSERQYDHSADGTEGDESWSLEILHNFMYGITERNLMLVTQMVRQ